ncbi:MAG: hypothetical protein R3A52_18030 [Polyangiales bacterium]
MVVTPSRTASVTLDTASRARSKPALTRAPLHATSTCAEACAVHTTSRSTSNRGPRIRSRTSSLRIAPPRADTVTASQRPRQCA